MKRIFSKLRTSILYRVNNIILDRLFSGNVRCDGGTVFLDSLNIKGGNRDRGVEYTPSSQFAINHILGMLPADYGNWTFIDIGAGKGRVLRAAARLPFRQVIGVEFAEELYREAEANLREDGVGRRSAKTISVVHEDAASFKIPDGQCVFYLFNPFDEGVMEKFIDQLISSYNENNRSITILYYNPIHHELFDSIDIFVEERIGWVSSLIFFLTSPHRLKLYRMDHTRAGLPKRENSKELAGQIEVANLRNRVKPALSEAL